MGYAYGTNATMGGEGCAKPNVWRDERYAFSFGPSLPCLCLCLNVEGARASVGGIDRVRY